ncbi:MAG: two-component system, NtrC family, nitrogen regulation response regulator GlnG [Betaproteobacteria bacterium]|jgi:two-component system nitrogen regulation response regulator GlnG|nr:two-component system, NtrC family, nitrogen regulation response regulator GlnG [Betaproteobacteria bacterium]
MKPVWIVDDDRSIRWVMEKALSREGIAFNSFSTAQEALDALSGGAPEVLVSDIRMPGKSGLELLQTVKTRHPAVPVIVMTAFSDLDSAVAAFQGGAYEYLPKPFDVDQAVELIRRALDESRREAEAVEPVGETPEILGHAPAMQEVFRAIGRLSQSAATVLITGESGTGKELVARALHRHSARGAKPFVAINTAAMPKDLLESELFGHERGAFTGAQQQRRGRFEQAEGGTLFLDEIGDMASELQTRLLRVLSDGTFYRVGGHQQIKANVRVIAATHQNLEDRVREGTFREDLYHRLNVIRLRLPSMRERPEDIPLLARHFLALSGKQLGVEPKRFSDEVLAHLSRLAFPGNVRQLENLCHWLTVMAAGQVIDVGDLPAEFKDQAAANAPDWLAALEQEVERRLARGETGILDTMGPQFERALIMRALARTGGRRIDAANLLGMGRNTITRKIQELGIEDDPAAPDKES